MEQSEVFCTLCGASNTSAVAHCFACGAPLIADADNEQTLTAQDNAPLLQHRYRLLRHIGEGGFSKVYQADDTYAHRIVAIKAVNLRGLTVQEKIEATDAFNREVRMLTHLNQHNLPRLYNHFSDAEHWYMVMDYIHGHTLEQQLQDRQQQPFPLAEVLELGYILCDVLDYLHHREPPIIFRDLKPANIMLAPEGHLYLIDFGIARHFKAGQHKDTIPFGSPGYAAPEQYGRAQTTPQADIYSLGAILHQLITGHDPAQSPFTFAPLTDQHTPAIRDFNTLIQSMVAPNSAQRPPTIISVRHRLQEIAESSLQTQGIYALPHTRNIFASRPTPNNTTNPATTTLFQTATGNAQTHANIPGNQQGQGVQQIQQMQTAYYPNAYYVPQSLTAAPRNIYATMSLIAGLLGIVALPVICSGIAIHHGAITSFLFLCMLVATPMIGIFCGHIGRSFAKKHAVGNKAALAGLIIAYTQLTIYVFLIMCSLSTFLFMR